MWKPLLQNAKPKPLRKSWQKQTAPVEESAGCLDREVWYGGGGDMLWIMSHPGWGAI
jgi:hypothetical protein